MRNVIKNQTKQLTNVYLQELLKQMKAENVQELKFKRLLDKFIEWLWKI